MSSTAGKHIEIRVRCRHSVRACYTFDYNTDRSVELGFIWFNICPSFPRNTDFVSISNLLVTFDIHDALKRNGGGWTSSKTVQIWARNDVLGQFQVVISYISEFGTSAAAIQKYTSICYVLEENMFFSCELQKNLISSEHYFYEMLDNGSHIIFCLVHLHPYQKINWFVLQSRLSWPASEIHGLIVWTVPMIWSCFSLHNEAVSH